MTTLFTALRGLLLACSAGLVLGAAAQDYPSRTLQIVVPFPPGGPTDVLGRVLAQGLSQAWGQPAIVENRSGAAGNIGMEWASKALPDGHTLAVVPAGNIAVNPLLFAALPYKASDFAPVAMLARVENVLVVNAAVPAASLSELLKLAADKSNQLSFASPGAGSQAHLAGELMAISGRVQLLHVPYKGVAPALNDLLGGQVSMMFAQVSSVLPHIGNGRLRVLGIASLKRSAMMPEVPTIAEQGLPGFEAVSWYALMVPRETPQAVIARLNAETVRLFARPELNERLSAAGLDAGVGSAEELAATIRVETARWGEVICQKHIKPE